MTTPREELQQQRAELVALMRSGVSSAKQGDNATTFRSVAEMRTLLAAIDSQLAALDGAAPPSRSVRLSPRSGY